jgi:hypothetical protein
MADSRRLTAIIERGDDGYVALSPEYDVARLPNPARTVAYPHKLRGAPGLRDSATTTETDPKNHRLGRIRFMPD